MASERSDPRRALEQMWGEAERPRRGPRPALTVRRIVAAALDIVETEGLAELSMRRVAARLGVGTASLYTYVPGKDELLALMLDAVIAEDPLPHTRPGTWREKFAAWARADWEDYRSHPWAVQLASVRQLTGPNALAWLESALRVLDGTGLTEGEMFAAVLSIDAYVHGQARKAIGEDEAERPVGDSGESWRSVENVFMAERVDFSQYPMMLRAAQADAFPDPAATFEFGLERLLDGIEALIERRAAEAGGGEG